MSASLTPSRKKETRAGGGETFRPGDRELPDHLPGSYKVEGLMVRLNGLSFNCVPVAGQGHTAIRAWEYSVAVHKMRSMHAESLSPRVFKKVHLNERRNGFTDGLRNAF